MTISVHIKYFGAFREVTGAIEERMALNEQAVLKDLFLALIRKYGDIMRLYILSDDAMTVPPRTIILVDGYNVAQGKGVDTALQNNNIILFMPHISGG